jgi:nucleoside 2-deoxyribosyltransferase
MKSIYLICPVRNTKEDFSSFVNRMESVGYRIHFPPRDCDQTMDGLSICTVHLAAMRACDEVWIIWDDESKGSHFDLGMAFALEKPVRLVKSLQPDKPGKNYLKIIKTLEIIS